MTRDRPRRDGCSPAPVHLLDDLLGRLAGEEKVGVNTLGRAGAGGDLEARKQAIEAMVRR